MLLKKSASPLLGLIPLSCNLKKRLIPSSNIIAPQAYVEHHCTSSIGVTLFNQNNTQEDILKWADAAMYQAKDDGRNLVRFYKAKA